MGKFSSPLSVLVLNASLKHGGKISNTEEVARMVLSEMKKISPIRTEIIRLSDKNIPVGLRFRESRDDEWPRIAEKIRRADIVLFATPIWWGCRSSLMQRVIERMDAFDEEYIQSGTSALLNKVAGIVITGSEDGAQAVMGGLMEALSFMQFTLPPNCTTYWVGEVGLDPKTDRARRRENPIVKEMAMHSAKSLIETARALKISPLS